MGYNRILTFFEDPNQFADFATTLAAPAARAASRRVANFGNTPSGFSPGPQNAHALDRPPSTPPSDATRLPAKGWCNYSI
jgi:hypothetical protein